MSGLGLLTMFLRLSEKSLVFFASLDRKIFASFASFFIELFFNDPFSLFFPLSRLEAEFFSQIRNRVIFRRLKKRMLALLRLLFRIFFLYKKTALTKVVQKLDFLHTTLLLDISVDLSKSLFIHSTRQFFLTRRVSLTHRFSMVESSLVLRFRGTVRCDSA